MLRHANVNFSSSLLGKIKFGFLCKIVETKNALLISRSGRVEISKLKLDESGGYKKQ